MSLESIFVLLKNFLETKPACVQAISLLSPEAEIRIVVDDKLECRLVNKEGRPTLTREPAPLADVEFRVDLEALRVLEGADGENMAALGIDIVKEIIAGHIKVCICRGVGRIFKGGYWKIIQAAGPDFTIFLAQYGLKSFKKWIDLFKALRRT
ncbi:MAG: hypothetical protein D6797_01690 [Bdellovibrio sp.]|nr:MAG: hypothetical protein D6797_01690 [Bdellovibrio sp.]